MNNANLPQLFDLLETFPNPVTLNELAYDENGVAYDKIIYLNSSFLKTIGYTKKEIPDDRTWFDKAYPDKAYQHYITSEWFKAMTRAEEDDINMIGFPAKVHCKDDKDRWFDVTTQINHPINGKYRTIIFVQTDAPEKNKLELDKKSIELTDERHLLKTIIDTAPIRIFWKDINGVYLGCNNAFLEDAHFDNENDIIGKTDYDMVWESDAELYREDDKKVRESGIPQLNYIESQTQTDGKFLTLSTSKVPLKDYFGNTIGVLGLYQDITEEYEAKKKMIKQEKFMIIQAKQAAMGEMISMIAHQWRQPLSSISAIAGTLSIDLMMDEYKKEFFEERLGTIAEISQHLSSTIDDFRSFLKEDKIMMNITLNELFESSLNIIGATLESKGVKIEREIENIVLMTYPNELIQVFLNLLKNAQEAMQEKEISEGKIWIHAYEKDSMVYCTFKDNAGGIPEEIINMVFNPYFTTKSKIDGTGIGLYMSKTIIEEHCKGSLTVSNQDEGAVFTIKLPILTLDTLQ